MLCLHCCAFEDYFLPLLYFSDSACLCILLSHWFVVFCCIQHLYDHLIKVSSGVKNFFSRNLNGTCGLVFRCHFLRLRIVCVSLCLCVSSSPLPWIVPGTACHLAAAFAAGGKHYSVLLCSAVSMFPVGRPLSLFSLDPVLFKLELPPF